MTTCTLVYLLRDGQVCLGFKKRGFGQGWWNGFGGKVHDGEDIRDAAVRELREECGVHVDRAALVDAGELHFAFREKPDGAVRVHLFRTTRFNGEPMETEEMLPKWFAEDVVPYDTMWADDRIWMPKFFVGERVVGQFTFERNRIVEYRLGDREVIHS